MYFYELHSHTNAASACGRVDPEDYVKFYKDLGYSGMVITDHFYYGNTNIDRDLDWEEHVSRYCEAYYRAKAEGDKQGFSVFFGLEYKFKIASDEYIILGVTPEWVKANGQMREMDRATFCDFVRAAGGYVIQAHPFRNRGYIRHIVLSLDHVDAIEVYNSGNTMDNCRQAYEYAKNLDLPMVGGSDIHRLDSPELHSGIALKEPAETIFDIIEAIKKREVEILPLGILEEVKAQPLEDPTLPVMIAEGSEFVETDNYFWAKK